MNNRFIRKANRIPFKELYQKNHWYFVTICVQDRRCVFEIVGKKDVENYTTGSEIKVEAGLSRYCDTRHRNETNLATENGTTGVPLQIESSFGVKAGLSRHCDTLRNFGHAASKIIIDTLQNLPNIYSNLILDQWVVMPNHIHFLIGFDGQPYHIDSNKKVSLGDIISRFKNDSRRKIVHEVEAGLSRHCDTRHRNETNLGTENGTTGVPLQTELNVESGLSVHCDKDFNHHKFWQKSYYDRVVRGGEDLDRIREYIANNQMSWLLDELNPQSGNFEK